jgi:hypothetical protein
MIAFYATVTELPPNLFYFLKKLSLTRLTFLPNIFAEVYQGQSSYDSSIPARIADIDGKYSFSSNAGGLMFFVFVYMSVSTIIYLFTTRMNTNRPLRELFEKIYQTRVRFGIIHDFLWIFSLNVFVCGFLQYYNLQNAGDVALATIYIIFFLALILALFIYRVRKYNDP